MRDLAILLLLVPATVLCLNCTVCDFKLQPPHNSACNETCEGDVCFIVVNKYFNGTINAGCMYLREGDSFEDEAICQRGPYDNRCACSTGDHCNNPKVKISTYTFTESPVLESYQWLPQIQPPMPALQPIQPPEIIGGESHGNETGIDSENTSTELENGVENDLAHILDDKNVTSVMRNEENEEGLLTVTTTVGINVRDHSNRANNDSQQEEEMTTARSFTPGQGSVEVTRVTQEVSPRMQPTRGNMTTDGQGPNVSGSTQVLLAAVFPILLQRLL